MLDFIVIKENLRKNIFTSVFANKMTYQLVLHEIGVEKLWTCCISRCLRVNSSRTVLGSFLVGFDSFVCVTVVNANLLGSAIPSNWSLHLFLFYFQVKYFHPPNGADKYSAILLYRDVTSPWPLVQSILFIRRFYRLNNKSYIELVHVSNVYRNIYRLLYTVIFCLNSYKSIDMFYFKCIASLSNSLTP